MGNGAVGQSKTPDWIYTVQFNPVFYHDGFGRLSPGCKSISLNTFVRHRKGCADTDGAIWTKGFSTGKHVFEIGFPQKLRKPYASIGVGVQDSELHLKKSATLVGKIKNSWGIDLQSKKCFANGLLVGKFPNALFAQLPDRFFMYLDMDNFQLMFGSDGIFYGVALQDEAMQKHTLYPMVSTAREGAVITMVYRGRGKVITGPIRKKRKPVKLWLK